MHLYYNHLVGDPNQIISPPSPSIVHTWESSDDAITYPPSGYIDPRIESSNGMDYDLGVENITLVFNEPIQKTDGNPLDASVFSIRVTGDGVAPQIIAVDAINNPDEVVRGKRKGEIERWIAHKLLDDGYMLRVIYEVKNKDSNVISLYISRRERYYRGGVREDTL